MREVAGSHNAVYEAYYREVDPNNQGSVGAFEAARFLKRSGLTDAILSKVWDLSDPAGKGYLNKDGFFVALKLVSLAQSGKEVNMVNISLDTPPPKMGGDAPPVIPIHNNVMSPPLITNSVALSDWAVKPAEKAKYDQLFDSLQPLNGMIPGNKVKGVLMDSKLPLHTLGKIWDLADMDKDGMLDRHEFMVAMHLVYKALEKYSIPSCLPPELLPPGNRKESAPAIKSIPVLPSVVGVEPKPPTVAPVIPWVVTAEERVKYDTLFQQTDVDKDGFVSGLEIKDIFLQSGVPQLVLARIWSLCDTKQIGKLNSEQFALAMWLINQKVQGIDPPASLTPEMVPPSLRAKVPAEGIVENNNAPYSNPELDMITKDIEELAREKHILETDIAQKEADIKIKNGEIKSLQSELDTLAATFKQLENQKGEAQKRLNDLKNQKTAIEKELDDVKLVLEEEQDQVDNLRRQAEEQEETLRSQEDELSCKKQELEGLKQEEARLEQKQKESRDKLDDLTKNLRDTQLQISQAKAKITQLQEQHRQMNDAVALCDSAIETGDASCVGDAALDIEPEFRNPEYRKLAALEQEKAVARADDPFGGLNGPVATSGFEGEDLFKNDPFKSEKPVTADPFSSSDDPFGSAFSTKISDPLPADPFGSFGGGTTGKADPFDPFGDGMNRNSSKSPVDMSGKDPFGCDPFASLQPSSAGAPPPRPESPSPALPPKKSKQPPPRPAPPRPMQQPGVARAAPAPPTPSPDPQQAPGGGHDPFADPFGDAAPVSDPFSAANSSGTNSFANFANFDSKFSGKALDFTEDPFRNYRYEDPFHITDPFSEERPPAADPFSGGGGGPPPSEDRQLAWAAAESLKLEKERRRRLEKERADLEYALALSRGDERPTLP